jgi:hypothetical protein
MKGQGKMETNLKPETNKGFPEAREKMKYVLLYFLTGFLVTQCTQAQVKPDQLKQETIQAIATCFDVYSRFQKTGDAAYLIKGTKHASKASVLLSLLREYFPKLLKSQDVDELTKIMDRLSGEIPARFVDNPSAVMQDIGFITFLHLARGSVEHKLGKLPEVNDEE